MNWDEYQVEFVPDGRLRNIYIKNTNADDWQAFVDFLRSTDAQLEYSIDGEPATLPVTVHDVLPDKAHSHLLAIGLDGVTVNCHFWVIGEIQLSFDPKDIDCEARAKIVFRLMSTVGRILKKEVILTPENSDDMQLFKYLPGTGVIYCHTS